MITHKATVKLFGALYSITGEGEPTTATAGVLGDIYLDTDADSLTYGNTWMLSEIDGSEYTWTLDNREDARINLAIERVEQDYLRMRGKPFDKDDAGDIVYPPGAAGVAAEMALYVLGITQGRGAASEGVADNSKSYEKKYAGYPVSLVAQVERFVGVV